MEAPPPASTGDPSQPQRFRIMCSYGGHIIPRPHDKTLSYIGGDTRIVLIDRHVSLADLHARLTKSLNQNYSFVLKYQLPNEDLDSLISVTTDEDLHNMIEEYDRLVNKQGRLRLFLFPKTVQSFDLGQVCGNKGSSDEWFMGILNGKVKSLSSAFSDSLNCLIGLELDDGDDKSGHYVSREGLLEGQLVENEKKVVGDGGITNQDVQSVPESPMIQTNSSSFGSTSSSKSVKVGVLGVEEQFQQISILDNSNYSNIIDQKPLNLKDEVTGLRGGGGDFVNRSIVSDDERSDHGDGHRKVQEGQQVQQRHTSGGGVFELTSPDSISSESSITNPMSRQRQAVHHQEPTLVQIQSVNNRTELNIADQIRTQPQIQESGYVLHGQYDPQLHHPQQFVQPGTQYIPGGPIPIGSYYPIYASQPQNHPNQPVLSQPYPVYFIQARPSQAYTLPQNYSELAPNASLNQPQKAPNPSNVAAPYNQTVNVPPETVSGGYRTLASTAPQFVQVPSSQQQQSNYVNYAQIHHPSQSMAQPLASNKAPYSYEVSDPAHAQMYYATTQPLAPPPHVMAQYQTMMPSSAVSDASSQNLTENVKQQDERW